MAKDRGIRLIAYLKLLKGILLILSGIGILKLLHEDAAEVVMRWIGALPVDPGNRHVQNLLLRASIIDERQLKELSIGSFLFAGLSLTEGSALLLQKPWAKYFTVAIMAALIPFELWELMERFSIFTTTVIAVNLVIVWYLVARIRNELLRCENSR